MTLFTIDEEKCDLCEVCVAACPAGLVAVTADSSMPVYVDRGEGACFDCGHCVAACPTGAFAHEHATADDCLPIRDGLEISAEQITQLMRGRRSVRNFTDEPVPRESLAELLDVARYAPSGCNAQPVQWLVVYDTDKVRQISELAIGGLRDMIRQDPKSLLSAILGRLVAAWDEGSDVVARGAPHLILTHAPKSDPLAPSACIIAQTYFELAASAVGLGACWMGLIDMTANTWPPLRDFLELPRGHVVLASMAIGNPAFQYARIPPRKELQITWR